MAKAEVGRDLRVVEIERRSHWVVVRREGHKEQKDWLERVDYALGDELRRRKRRNCAPPQIDGGDQTARKRELSWGHPNFGDQQEKFLS